MALTREDVWLSGGKWMKFESIPAKSYICGYCGNKVSSKEGCYANQSGPTIAISHIYLCPDCDGPTLFTRAGKRSPGNAPGNPVAHVPGELSKLYNEARLSAAAGAYTGAVLICRKMLMNIAVAEGADEGKNFVTYVQYLADKGFVPPNGMCWVDYIRRRGNEATHEIELMEEGDTTALITFVEMLLRFIYEFPKMVPAGGASP